MTHGATTCCSCTGTTSGRYLGAYGHPDVSSPRLDPLAAEGILFTSAHATAPLCSPSRGSLFTGRYPQSNGLVGLAHHGWEYRRRSHAAADSRPNTVGTQRFSGCSTRRRIRPGWVSTSSTCRTPTANTSSTRRSNGCTTHRRRSQPFLLTAGFFETHRPYPRDRYEPADPDTVDPPDYLPDTARGTPGSGRVLRVHHHRRRRGRPDVGHAGRHRAGRQHLGGVPHRPRRGVPASEVHAVRRGHRHRDDRPPAHRHGAGATASTTICSAASIWSRRCWSCSASTVPTDVEGMSHAQALLARRTAPSRCAITCTRRRPTTTRSIRSARSARKNSATSRTTHRRPLLDLPWDIEESPSGQAVAPLVTAPAPGTRTLRPARRSHRDQQPAGRRRHRRIGRDRRRSRCPPA